MAELADKVEAYFLGLAARRPLILAVWGLTLFLAMGASVARHSDAALASAGGEREASLGFKLVARSLGAIAEICRWAALLGVGWMLFHAHAAPVLCAAVGALLVIAQQVAAGSRVELVLWPGAALVLDTRTRQLPLSAPAAQEREAPAVAPAPQLAGPPPTPAAQAAA